MARRRMIDPDFWASKRFFLRIFDTIRELFPSKPNRFCYQTCRNVRLFYIGLWNYADDFGKFLHDPCKIKGEIAPYDQDLKSFQIETFLKILHKSQRVYLYMVDNVAYGIILNFLEHQTISHPTPSKIPDPIEEEFSRLFPETFQNLSRNIPLQVKLSKEEVKLRLREEPDKTSLVSPEKQNQTTQFCQACKLPMADEFDKWFCSSCGIRKPKRIIHDKS